MTDRSVVERGSFLYFLSKRLIFGRFDFDCKR